MKNQTIITSDLPIPPGEFIQEVLAEMNLQSDVVFKKLNLSKKKFELVISGVIPITTNIASKLSSLMNIPVHILTGLENEYRITLKIKQDR